MPKVVKVFQKCQTPCLVSISFFVYQTLQPHSSAPSLLHLSQSLTAPGKLRIEDRSQKNPTAMGRPCAAGGSSKDGEGCGAWAGGHGVDAKASTPRGPIQSKPQGSCRAGRGLKRSWRAEQGDLPVHRKKHLCKPHHKKPCTNSTLARGLGEMKADNEEPGQGQHLEERSPAQ